MKNLFFLFLSLLISTQRVPGPLFCERKCPFFKSHMASCRSIYSIYTYTSRRNGPCHASWSPFTPQTLFCETIDLAASFICYWWATTTIDKWCNNRPRESVSGVRPPLFVFFFRPDDQATRWAASKRCCWLPHVKWIGLSHVKKEINNAFKILPPARLATSCLTICPSFGCEVALQLEFSQTHQTSAAASCRQSRFSYPQICLTWGINVTTTRQVFSIFFSNKLKCFKYGLCAVLFQFWHSFSNLATISLSLYAPKKGRVRGE